ncbi:hypothetical protein [Mesoplasma corruscae]|uniref:Transposase n=1 Tax=Mesoplasma corruscae TaxID=216874 RepID=A0A2S5RFV7_9MOLU|nr:hypothetical protein [Mesoplasma corruscae]PPE06190.1 transposase [Mesoplasma corruscae]
MEDKSVDQQDFKHFLNECILDSKSAHPLQPRKDFFGKWAQADAFIYDSTGIVLSAYFDKQETLNGYYRATKQMFENYGTWKEVLTNKRTVFYSTKKNTSKWCEPTIWVYV